MRYWVLKGKKRSEFGYVNDFAAMRRGVVERWGSKKMLGQTAPGDRLFVFEGSPRFEFWGLAEFTRRVDATRFEMTPVTDALEKRVQRDVDGIGTNLCWRARTS